MKILRKPSVDPKAVRLNPWNNYEVTCPDCRMVAVLESNDKPCITCSGWHIDCPCCNSNIRIAVNYPKTIRHEIY